MHTFTHIYSIVYFHIINGCSYKEDTDEATDSDDIIEAATPAEAEEDNRETIEKVIEARRGKKGGKQGYIFPQQC